MFDITIFCPDTHILYTGDLPDTKGVGGGIVARIRLAQALVRLGHKVTIIAHVTHPHTVQGVVFLPLAEVKRKKRTDILILVSSGGALSILPAQDLKIKSKWRSVWLHGVPYIEGLDRVEWDELNPCSNFISTVIRTEWPLSTPRIFTVYNGTTKFEPSAGHTQIERDPFRLIYFSHPDKGLEAAIEVLKRLRRKDKRFHMHVYGGGGLYGGEDKEINNLAGITFFGTQRQSAVLGAARMSLAAMLLQAIEEGFGLVLTESMMHGAIPLASPVGAYTELIRHGHNGILIEEEFTSDAALDHATEWILRLNKNPDLADYIRRNAINLPWTWDRIAKVWVGHWNWVLKKKGTLVPNGKLCSKCEGELIALADGYHCTECGWYYQDMNEFISAD